MNNGMYGFGMPPNYATRVAPPQWANFKLITATTSTEYVPQNVYLWFSQCFGLIQFCGVIGGYRSYISGVYVLDSALAYFSSVVYQAVTDQVSFAVTYPFFSPEVAASSLCNYITVISNLTIFKQLRQHPTLTVKLMFICWVETIYFYYIVIVDQLFVPKCFFIAFYFSVNYYFYVLLFQINQISEHKLQT